MGVNFVAALLWQKRNKNENNKKIPEKKQRIQTSIRRHVAQLQEWNRGKLSKYRVKADLERKYYVKNKDPDVVIKEMKQRIKAETAQFQKYDERNN